MWLSLRFEGCVIQTRKEVTMRRWQKVLLRRGRRRDVIVPVLSEADIKIGLLADRDLDSTTLWQRSKQTSLIHKCLVPALLSLYFLSLDEEVCSETDPPLPPISLIILLWAILVCLVVNLMRTYHIALELFQCALLILGWSDFNSCWECIWPSLALERSWVALWSSRFWVQLWWTIS